MFNRFTLLILFLLTLSGVLGLAFYFNVIDNFIEETLFGLGETLIIGALVLWLRRTSLRKNQSISSALGLDEKSGAASQKRLRSDTLTAFRETVQTHLKSKDHKKDNPLQAPWYLAIGAANAGKTSSFLNSELDFTTTENNLTQAFAPPTTEQCQFFISKEAVIADTPGRFCAKDNQSPQDTDDWHDCLDSLKKLRSGRPLDGVIVAISLSDLLDSDALEDQLSTLSERLQDIQSAYNAPIPTYLLITKCDQITGFNAFFDGLTLLQRKQIFGGHLSSSRSGHEALSSLTQSLLEKLRLMKHFRLLDSLTPEQAVQVHGFDHQFQTLTPTLYQVAKQLSSGKGISFRGLYLTAGQQAPNPDHHFFAEQIMTRGVLPEATLLNQLSSMGRFWHWVKPSLQITGIAFALFLSLAATRSFIHAQQSFGFLSTTLHQLKPNISPERHLNTLQKAFYVQNNYHEHTLFSLSLSSNRLNNRFEAHYFQVLDNHLSPIIKSTLQAQLAPSLGSTSYSADALKVDMMIKGQLDFDAGFIHEWFYAHSRQLPAHKQSIAKYFQDWVKLHPQRS